MGRYRPVTSVSAGATAPTSSVPIALLAALAISSGLFFSGFDNAAGQATACILCASLLGLCLWLRQPSETAWRSTVPVLLPAALAFAWSAAPGALGVERAAPDLVTAGLLSYVAGLSALIAGWWIGRRRALADETVGWLVAFGSVHVLLGQSVRLAGAAGEFGFWRVVRDGRFQGLIGNVNVTASISGAIALIALSRLLRRREEDDRRHRAAIVGWAVAVTVSAGGVVTTASRLPIVALVALATALAASALARGRRRPMLPILALVGAAALSVAALVTLVDRIRERFDILSDSMALRVTMWTLYRDVAAAAPWFGYGPNGFPSAAAGIASDPHTAQGIWMSNSAHDLPLQLVLAGGLPYLAFLLTAAIAWAWPVQAWLRRSGGIEDWGLAAALALVGGVAMIDIVLDVPVGIVLTLFVAGLLWGLAQAPKPVGVALPHRTPA